MRLAIVGTGISGLVCAQLLQQEHELTLFEAGGHVGGHSVLLMLLGSIAIAGYLLIQLFRLPRGASMEDLLLRKAT